jgi:uncharacterized protein (UPF0332 family)/predicted nucleotidyltransferase
MAKKEQKQETKSEPKPIEKTEEKPMFPDMESLPKEAQEKLAHIKDNLEKFKTKVIEKFDKYVAGIALLPPDKPEEGKEVDKNKINVLVLIDDTDSQKMTKQELKAKLAAIIEQIAKDINKDLAPNVVIFTELWQACYDAKYELLQLIAMSAPVHDLGMLSAIKIAEIHKNMVLKKFEKYIVSYVLAGSLVQGKATKESDIDVFVVIDDTDVKKMTRAELKDKLRAIIIGMGIEAGEMTGIKNKINIQVYILTDFWDSIREANPIIFTFLRDGVPFYDRGIFMPWKQLLKMGKIRPSMEAIEMYMQSGEQMLQRVQLKIKEIGMEDIFYALLTPSQAALMLFGLPPPTPKETPGLMREVFVKKEKLLDEASVQVLERVIQIRKDIEHGTKKELTGKELDELLADGDKFLKRVKKLFTQIEKVKEEEGILHTYETVITIIRDILKLEGIEKVKDTEIINYFEKEVVSKGTMPEKFLRILKQVIKAKQDYDAGKLSKVDMEEVKKKSFEFIKFMVEYLQRKRGRELDRVRIRVKHGDKFGEVILLGSEAFIIHDIENEEKYISKAKISDKGELTEIQKSDLSEYEQALAKVDIPAKTFIKEKLFENLKDIFGKDVEILLNY